MDIPSQSTEQDDTEKEYPTARKSSADRSKQSAPAVQKPNEFASEAQKETLNAIKEGERIALIIAGVVAIATIGQWVTTSCNNASTSAQAGKLIAAADINAAAAERFASEAGRINDGVSNAVSRLQLQANQTQRAADAARSAAGTAENALYLEQRPWVGIQITTHQNFAIAGGEASVVDFVAHNTGRTPAVRFREECCERVDQELADPIPDYDTLHSDIGRSSSDQLRAYIRSNPRKAAEAQKWELDRRAREEARAARDERLVIVPDGTIPIGNLMQIEGRDHLHHFTLGRFVYWDVLDPSKKHVTTWCLVRLGGSPLQLCTGGQDMN